MHTAQATLISCWLRLMQPEYFSGVNFMAGLMPITCIPLIKIPTMDLLLADNTKTLHTKPFLSAPILWATHFGLNPGQVVMIIASMFIMLFNRPMEDF